MGVARICRRPNVDRLRRCICSGSSSLKSECTLSKGCEFDRRRPAHLPTFIALLPSLGGLERKKFLRNR